MPTAVIRCWMCSRSGSLNALIAPDSYTYPCIPAFAFFLHVSLISKAFSGKTASALQTSPPTPMDEDNLKFKQSYSEGCITSYVVVDIQSCELPWHEAQVAGYSICKGDLCIFQSWRIHYSIHTQHKIIRLCIFNKHFLTP